MSGTVKFLSAAAVAVGLVAAGQPAQADDVRRVPTASPVPGFVPNPTIYPPPTPGWPRPPFPRPPFPGPWPVPPVVDYDYAVYVRVGGFVGWRHYATYESRYQAERVERLLELRGYPARVVRVPDQPHILGR
jgi:hypothetical protein